MTGKRRRADERQSRGEKGREMRGPEEGAEEEAEEDRERGTYEEREGREEGDRERTIQMLQL